MLLLNSCGLQRINGLQRAWLAESLAAANLAANEAWLQITSYGKKKLRAWLLRAWLQMNLGTFLRTSSREELLCGLLGCWHGWSVCHSDSCTMAPKNENARWICGSSKHTTQVVHVLNRNNRVYIYLWRSKLQLEDLITPRALMYSLSECWLVNEDSILLCEEGKITIGPQVA